MAGVFVGVVISANDIALLAHNRTTISRMFKTCEVFATKNKNVHVPKMQHNT